MLEGSFIAQKTVPTPQLPQETLQLSWRLINLLYNQKCLSASLFLAKAYLLAFVFIAHLLSPVIRRLSINWQLWVKDLLKVLTQLPSHGRRWPNYSNQSTGAKKLWVKDLLKVPTQLPYRGRWPNYPNQSTGAKQLWVKDLLKVPTQ